MIPLERAKWALCLEAGLDPDRKFKSSDRGPATAPHEDAWHEFQPGARAVLQAIRELGEAMKAAGAGADLEESGDKQSYMVWLAPTAPLSAGRP